MMSKADKLAALHHATAQWAAEEPPDRCPNCFRGGDPALMQVAYDEMTGLCNGVVECLNCQTQIRDWQEKPQPQREGDGFK